MAPRPRARRGLLPAAIALAVVQAACGRQEPAASVPVEPRPPLEARTAVDRAIATTGDVITYRVTVDREQNLEIEVPEPGAEIAGFRIFDMGREEAIRRRGRVIEERWYKLRADLVGSYVLPPVTVRYRPRAADGDQEAAWKTAETSALFVEIESVLPAEGEADDIRGLKPLQRVQRGPPWAWIVGVAAALLLAAVALIAWRRRPRPVAPPIPPHEIVFRELDALRATDFQDAAAVRRFYFRISEVVRAYVEGRWGLNATDLTTEEILSELGGLSLPVAEAPRLEGFLLGTDRVKFADHQPAADEIRETYERALGFVEATRPQPEQEAA